MKKGTKLVLFVILGIILLLIIIALVFLFNKKEPITNYVQGVSLENNKIENSKVNGIDLTYGKIEFDGNVYHISMHAKNNTDEVVDMSDYRISFRNIQDEEIEWFRGTTIGKLNPGEEVNLYVDSFKDLSTLDHLTYVLFSFQY